MGIANFTLNRIFNQYQEQLKESKIERIISISETTFIFSMFKNNHCYDLLMSLDPSLPIFLLSNKSKNYERNQNNYCTNMLIKYFDHGYITKLEKIDNDRIVIFYIKKWTPTYQLLETKLIFELFPLSPNIIITDSNNLILDAFKRSESMDSKHLIYKGITYTFPHSEDKNIQENSSLENLKGKLNRAEYQYLSTLSNDDFKVTLKNMLKEKDFYLYKNDLSSLIISSESQKVTLDELYNLIINKKINDNKEQKNHDLFKLVEQKRKSLNKKIINLQKDLIKFENYQNYAEYGNLLYSGVSYQKGLSEIVIDDIKIPLDSQLDLSENAQRYFKLYKKSKSGIEQVKIQLEKTKEEITYFDRISNQLQFAQNNEIQEIVLDLIDHHYIKEHKVQKQLKLRPKNKKFTPHFIKLANGTKIGYGLTSYQNEELTFSLSKKEDTYLHVKDYHGPHVIIFSNNPSDEELLIGGEIACYFANITSGEVQYTLKKYVKKVPENRGLALLSQYKSFVIKEIRPSTLELLDR